MTANRQMRLTTPIQAWLPALSPAAVSGALRRDLERAQRAWQGESTVWLIPGFKEPRRWKMLDPPYLSEMALPSEEFNCVDVFHIGTNGWIALDWPTRFVEPTVDALLQDWLAVGADPSRPEPGLRWFRAGKEIELEVPHLEDDEIVYRSVKLVGQPVGTMEMKASGDYLEMRWPPAGRPLPTISPDAESHDYFGDFEWDELGLPGGRRLPVLTSTKHAEVRSLPIVDQWPGRLRELFPAGGGPDAMLGAARMARIASASSSDREGAFEKARALTAHYAQKAFAPYLYTWLYPILLAKGEAGLLDAIYARYDAEFETVGEALKSSEFRERMNELGSVIRCTGVLGLMGALLVNELAHEALCRRCEHCGAEIRGRSHKRFCSREDNADCFRERGARKLRRQRAQRKARKLSGES